MYDELIKALHEGAEFLECSTPGIKNSFAKMCHNAADAIEELSHDYEKLAEDFNGAVELLHKRSKPGWIPVAERLPQYGERVLVFGGVTMYVAYYDKNRYGGENWHKLNSKSHYCNPTHWMPLPQPPEEDG